MKNACKCKGATLLLDMADLYEKMGHKGHSIYYAKDMERKKAGDIVKRGLKIISPKDVYNKGENANLWKSHLRDAKTLLAQCNDGIGSDCIYALEYLRAAIHGDWGLRAKLMCEDEVKPPFSDDNNKILKAMYALRGAFYGTPKDAFRILKNLKDKYC